MRTTIGWVLGLGILAAAGFAGGIFLGQEAPEGSSAGGGDFLESFWSHPVPAQGRPPADFTDLEASLDPAECGKCHRAQWRQWRQSLHSEAMGAGILWQLRVKTPEQAKSCMRCHAPLAEQKALVGRELGWSGAPEGTPPGHIPGDLHRQGLVCAGCHVRDHTRYGPPAASAIPADKAPHGGFVGKAAFGESRFCASCHQFDDGGPSLNGKLRENTFREWQQSRYAERGVSCQDCHMAEGRHTWKGIHDRDMVRRAIGTRLQVQADGQEGLRVTGRLTNTGAGHKLPTYLTPKLFLELVLFGPEGTEKEVLARRTVGWWADAQLNGERFDTRLDPGESLSLSAQPDVPEGPGWSVGLRVRVAPQEHYERLFRHMFQQKDRMDSRTLELLRQALAEAEATRFTAQVSRKPLPASP